MVTIYLLEKYNNYFNRLIKRGETISDYTANRQYNAFSVDFNPNDGVTTEQIVNWTSSWMPDYLLVTDNSDIEQRWFVTEAIRTRGKQYKLTLKRDVIADFKNDIVNSPVYIDKGIIRDATSPLLLNNEGVNVNQIKTGEKKLFDVTGVPWLVMYLNKGTVKSQQTVSVNYENNNEYIQLSTPIRQWSFYDYIENDYLVPEVEKTFLMTQVKVNYGNNVGYKSMSFGINENANSLYKNGVFVGAPNLEISSAYNWIQLFKQAYIDYGISSVFNTMRTAYTFHKTNELAQYDGKIIKDSEGKYFRIYLENLADTDANHLPILNNGSTASLFTMMQRIFNNAYGTSQIANITSFYMSSLIKRYRISIREIPDFEGVLNFSGISGFNTIVTENPLYDIICMPYGDCYITHASYSTAKHYTQETSLAIMNSIAQQLTSSKVLDLQLLPYCPIQSLNVIDDMIYVGADMALPIIKDNVRVMSVLIAPSGNFTFTLNENYVPTKYDFGENSVALNVKYQNDCTLLRLCSPNYNGLFDFNVAKNASSVNGFIVDCTYKPYTPYIHVSPNFTFVYGHNFGDARGLICGGDFSLGIINDAWNNYEIQNKNYQNIFDRQIQNMDVNYTISRQEAGWQMAAGAVQAGASGAMTGALAGGGAYGAIAGAVIGGGVSLAGGAMDLSNMAKRQQEAVSLSSDMYSLQLGNVKALPLSITRTSAITQNNKLVPFLEMYECSEKEREAYINKLKYDGMTIGIIDELSNWITEEEKSFVKGRLIRLETISDDTHLFNAIYEELSKGVYL